MSNLPILSILFEFRLGHYFEVFIDFLTSNLSWLFGFVSFVIESLIDSFELYLYSPPFFLVIFVLSFLTWLVSSKWLESSKRLELSIGTAVFLGFFLPFENSSAASPTWVTLIMVMVIGFITWVVSSVRLSLIKSIGAAAGTFVVLFLLELVNVWEILAGFLALGDHWTLTFALILTISTLAWLASGKKLGLTIGTFLGLVLIDALGLWPAATQTIALILVASTLALLIGIPTGIYASRNKMVSENIIRPILDFMQTMPAFVYLIPAVIFFGLGPVAGAIATVIFSMPPVVRLTNLGIRQVPAEVVEAARSLGSTPRQLLLKVQLPIALPTILAGVNQTILLALSMVVIASMIGAGGLGNPVLRGITSLDIGTGFEGGVSVVVLAMILDRITQALGESTSK